MVGWFYGNQNYSVFDSIWVLVHLSSGVGVGALISFLSQDGKRFRHQVTALHVLLLALLAWEVVEGGLRWIDLHLPALAASLKSWLYDGFFEYEHPVNIVSDLVVGSVGGAITMALVMRSRAGSKSHHDGRPSR
jgi:hypothetical protein